ncbi:MAG TPA: hypothetical protein VG408_09205, partial [Actinomycetota bacterium]|nr:hypothetical protein [Actinomycetota bacterium]
MRIRSLLLSAILALGGFVAAVPVAASAQADAQHVGTMSVGDALFWKGPHVANSGVPAGQFISYYSAQACSSGSVRCFDFTFDVAETADKLRVAFDHPD